MELIIPRDLAQAILNYLAGKPYIEVFEFIAQLRALKEVPKPEETPE
jgi:hypothetical protein